MKEGNAARLGSRATRPTEAIYKTCGCGRDFTKGEWSLLDYVGLGGDEFERFESRNCACGSTISVVFERMSSDALCDELERVSRSVVQRINGEDTTGKLLVAALDEAPMWVDLARARIVLDEIERRAKEKP